MVKIWSGDLISKFVMVVLEHWVKPNWTTETGGISLLITRVYSEPWQTSKMELFANIVSD